MKRSLSLALLTALFLGCHPPHSLGDSGRLVVRHGAIADIACGPSALFP